MRRHLPFQPHFIWTAVLLGLFGGFGLGAHLVYLLAFGSVPGKSFAALIQVHGHLQLIGWTGFFIIGVSLFKLPRLMSSPPLNKYVSYSIFITLLCGLLLKSVAQVLLFYSNQEAYLRMAVMTGSLLESAGILVFFFALFKNSVTFYCKPGAYAASSIKPFLLVSLLGWFGYAIVNGTLGITFLREPGLVLSPHWNNFAVETYVHLVLLPTCFAFSISTFPIFLRLRAPTWSVARVSAVYALGTLAYLFSVAAQASLSPEITAPSRVIGVCIRTAAILWLVAELDLIRRKKPWFRKFRDNQDRDNRPPRPNAGDYGQFGNFEWLIYAAYGWLVIAIGFEFAGIWFHSSISISIIRHFYLLGFVTHLILGMGVRIVPGFLGKNRIAYPSLVRLSLLLILLATTSRTLPIVFSLFDNKLFRLSYGFSGILAMMAIAVLAVNLIVTVQQNKRSLST